MKVRVLLLFISLFLVTSCSNEISVLDLSNTTERNNQIEKVYMEPNLTLSAIIQINLTSILLKFKNIPTLADSAESTLEVTTSSFFNNTIETVQSENKNNLNNPVSSEINLSSTGASKATTLAPTSNTLRKVSIPTTMLTPNETDNTPEETTEKLTLSQIPSRETKNLFSLSKYQEAIVSFENEKSFDALYYRGMSYYCLMSKSSYTYNEKLTFKNNAVKDLYNVYSQYEVDVEKRALAMFWYTMANYIFDAKKKTAIKNLRKITEDPVLSQTKRYNDSLYLIALFSGDKTITQETIDKLSQVTNDDNIWDSLNKKSLDNQGAIVSLKNLLASL